MLSIVTYLKSILLVLVSITICVSVVFICDNSLKQYYSYSKNIASEDSINEIISELYPDAYEPYTNLDYLIGDYNYINHIYKLDFTQKMPIYLYVITTNNISSSATFLIMFNDDETIQDILFLDNSNYYDGNFYTMSDLYNVLKDENANDLDLDSVYYSDKNNKHIIDGIESAALNLIYEVK